MTLEAVLDAVETCRNRYLGFAESDLRMGLAAQAEFEITRAAELGLALSILRKCQRHAATVFPLLNQSDAKLKQERQAKEQRDARNFENRKRWAEKRRAQ